ncbi:diacylglycerol kinase [Mycobacterium sp. NS-7484]|uniref:NAD(P)H-dependent amine dehydrogenase family protein n=1 Tax=Mycobacterium sp. NS-7484 TaxID=1834161 RepID=UPI00096EC9C5|nr:Gfo/Idh/MocA family oxidoreductase [Mycobacterium sp. NS-7484]OMB98144.1 diacylglycerol kinase [Mycobacterium sp. NS-7484]
MTIRVAAIGTGNVGRHALAQLVTNPDYELTGVWVSSSDKAGKDAGELAGLDVSTGVQATDDLDAILADKPDCVVYTALADNRLPEALEDYRRILAAGVNVVASSAVFLQYPWQVLPAELIEPIETAAQQGGVSLFVNGIDPGFANDLLPLALAGTCQQIEQIRCMEIVDYATYNSPAVMFDVMGFGKPIDETPMLLQPGVLSLAWGSVVRQLAAGLGVELDEVTEEHTRVPAPEDFDIAAGHIPAGTTAALRFEVRGMRDGRPAVVLEHVTRLRDDLCPDWPQPAQEGGSYRVVVTGEPSYTLDLCLSSPNGDHNHAGLVATAARVVNAIPAVVAAEPGIRTTLDLPLVTGRGLYVG